MAIARLALGTANGKLVSSLSIADALVAPGDSVIVSIYHGNLAGISGITVAGVALTAISQQAAIWWLRATELLTGAIVATFNGNETAALVASRYSGLLALPFDRQATASGDSTAPDSGATLLATSQNDELLAGAIGTLGPLEDGAGSWGGSFTAGQRAGTTGGAASSNITIAEGFRIVTATGAYSAAKSGITSRPWYAELQTFKGAAGASLRRVRLRAGTRRVRLVVGA